MLCRSSGNVFLILKHRERAIWIVYLHFIRGLRLFSMTARSIFSPPPFADSIKPLPLYPNALQLPADGRDKMLQWRQAVTRKKMPTTSPPIPPTTATKLSPEGPFKSARCRLTIIRIPRAEKPRDRLTKLIVVHIFRSGCRWNSRSNVSVFGLVP